MMLVFSTGYFCGGLSAALLASIKWKSVITFYHNVEIFYSIYGEIAQHIADSSIIHACDAVAVSHSNKCMHNIVWFESHAIGLLGLCLHARISIAALASSSGPFSHKGRGLGMRLVLLHGIGGIYM